MDRSSTHSTQVDTGSERATVPPAPPTTRELEILRRVIEATPGDGATQLLDQLRMLQVAPDSDETTRIYLVHPDAPRADCSRGARAKVATVPVRSRQDRVIGEVALWVDHGHLCALQYVACDGRPTLTLPDPDLLDLPHAGSAVPMSVCVRGGREALAGVRVLRDAHGPQVGKFATPARFHPGRVATFAASLLVLALTILAFAVGSSGGQDLDAASAAGTAAGRSDGAANGELAGSFTGMVEGELAGRASTWQTSYEQARTRTLVLARRAAIKRRKAAEAAAAAAAAQSVAISSAGCSGYRDSRGYWVCS